VSSSFIPTFTPPPLIEGGKREGRHGRGRKREGTFCSYLKKRSSRTQANKKACKGEEGGRERKDGIGWSHTLA